MDAYADRFASFGLQLPKTSVVRAAQDIAAQTAAQVAGSTERREGGSG